jgi:SET domain-containing protein
MSRFDMAAALNLVVFAESSIHGTGGFAGCDLEPETRLIEYFGERISKEESLRRCVEGNTRIFSLDDEWDLDGEVESNQARWLNHSCDPNCEARLEDDGQIWITSVRRIAAGEELTFNYGYDLEDWEEHPCRCGSSACVGFMVAEEFYDVVRGKAGGQHVSA